MLNSSLIKQKFIMKQPEKSHRTGSVQNRPPIVEAPVKKTCQFRPKTVRKAVRGKQEKESSKHEKSKQEKMITTVLGSTKGKEHALAPKLAPFCFSPLPFNLIKCKIFFVLL